MYLIKFRPDGQSPDSSGRSRWPLRPGVLVHVNKISNLNMSTIPLTSTRFKTTAVTRTGRKLTYKKNKNKVFARIKDILGFRDQDSVPFGIYRSSTGGT